MRFTSLVLFGATTFLLIQGFHQVLAAQNSSPTPAATSRTAGAQEPADASSTVDPSQPVITVRGVCNDAAVKTVKDDASCTRVITREQFENLMKALTPSGQRLPPNARKNLAKTYAEFLAVEAAARRAGMEDTPQFREVINWMRLRAVSELYRSSLQEKYSNPSQEEIDGYYKQHLAEFERVSLARILVPRESLSAPDKDQFDKKAHTVANTARERAVHGEDPAQIQKEAYAALGLTAPPPTDLGSRRRTELIPEEGAEVFSLKVGEVSQVETEAKSYVIYKVVNKDALLEDQVKTDISRQIYQQKFKDAMKSAVEATPADFNEQYFGSGTGAPPSSGPTVPARPSTH